MSETVYITDEQRDLILRMFGGVRAERVTEMVAALEVAQSALAMLTEPKTIQSTNVREAWSIAVEAEMKCRSALSKATQAETGKPND